MDTVYVVEPQALFGPRLARLVTEAGGRVAATATTLDLSAIVAAAPDAVLLDLDFTAYDVAEALDVLRNEAPAVRPIVLTAEHGEGWLEKLRAAGAAGVVSKDATEEELVHDLRIVLDGGAVWDVRVEACWNG
jgi:DNA-binding NarL/FixJ family response regulator